MLITPTQCWLFSNNNKPHGVLFLLCSIQKHCVVSEGFRTYLSAVAQHRSHACHSHTSPSLHTAPAIQSLQSQQKSHSVTTQHQDISLDSISSHCNINESQNNVGVDATNSPHYTLIKETFNLSKFQMQQLEIMQIKGYIWIKQS